MSFLSAKDASRWTGISRGHGYAMGDAAPAPVDPVVRLAQQVNRFGPQAPAGYRFADREFPLASGKISPDLALAALLIFQRRSTDAYNAAHDQGSANAIQAANEGFADPVGFVTSNLATVTQTVALFGDSLGLPAPAGPGAAAGGGIPTALYVVAGALILWGVLR